MNRIRVNGKSETVPARRSRRSKKRGQSDLFASSNRQLTVLCLPALIKIFVFSIIPMIWFVIAFQQFIPHLGILYSPWVGWRNFELLFSTDLPRLITNAVVLNVLNMFIPLLVQIILGLFLYEVKKRRRLKIIQTIMFFPFFISWPLVGTIIGSLLGEETGMLTHLVYAVSGKEIRFYDDPKYWRTILIIASTWKAAGVNAVLYYAVLLGNDQSMYEAADVDGANRWEKMWYLSLPSLKLMILLGLIQASANIVRVDFSWVYYSKQNSKQLYPVTETIETYMFNALRTSNNFMIGTAVGLVQSVLGVILSFIVNFIIKHVSPESWLF